MDADLERSVRGLQKQIAKIHADKPHFIEIGQQTLNDLNEAGFTLLASPQKFDEVAGSILKARERQDTNLSGLVTTWLSKIAPLAGIALGLTGFAAEVSRFFTIEGLTDTQSLRPYLLSAPSSLALEQFWRCVILYDYF